MARPLLTIITVAAYENERLKRTLASLNNLTEEVEHLLVVPKNDHETLAHWNKWLKTKQCHLINDSNMGVYPAMKLGVEKSTGKYYLFLNAGDVIVSELGLTRALNTIRTSHAHGIIFQSLFDWSINQEPTLGNLNNFIAQKNGAYISHQSIVFARDFASEFAVIDTRFKVAADFKQIIQLAQSGTVIFSKNMLVRVEYPSLSSQSNRRGRVESAIITLRYLNFPNNVKAFCRILLREIRDKKKIARN